MALRVCAPFSAEDVDAGNEQAMARGEGGLPSLLNSGARSGGRGLGGLGGGSGWVGGGRGLAGGSRREEAERRRQLALHALDSRLHAATVRPPPVTHVGPNPLGETEYTPEPSPETATRQETNANEDVEQRA